MDYLSPIPKSGYATLSGGRSCWHGPQLRRANMNRWIFALVAFSNTLACATTSHADPVDCEAIKGSLIPYEVILTKVTSISRGPQTTQVFRSSTGIDSSTTKFKSPYLSYIQKVTSTNGWFLGIDRQNFRAQSVQRPLHATTEYEWPDNRAANFAADARFVLRQKREELDSRVTEFIADASYTFRKTESISIGPCTFSSHLGKIVMVDRNTKAQHSIHMWYFPDLRLAVAHETPDVMFESIATSFEPLEFSEPNWPPKELIEKMKAK